MPLSARGFRLKRSAAVAAVVVGVIAAVPAIAAMCARPSDQAALNARMLQTSLMVAALSCGERRRYNAFVTKFRAQLVPRGRALRRLFERTYGGRAESELNRFITRIANERSLSRLDEGSAYCPTARNLFARVLEASPRNFDSLTAALPFANDHGIATCPAPAKPTIAEAGRTVAEKSDD